MSVDLALVGSRLLTGGRDAFHVAHDRRDRVREPSTLIARELIAGSWVVALCKPVSTMALREPAPACDPVSSPWVDS